MKRVTLIALALIATTSAEAAVTISRDKTKNENCTAGVCTPTGPNANVSVRDLKKMLAHGDAKVVTGQGSVTIGVLDALAWTSGHRLTLDANQSIHIRARVTVEGPGGVTLITNDGGTGGDYTFRAPGLITFWDLSSSLVINGNSYVLVRDLTSLANDIATNPSGNYAFAASYDASQHNKYRRPVIPAEFHGTFEGLGNAIQNLTILVTKKGFDDPAIGLFLQSDGTLRDIALTDVSIAQNLSGGYAGALAAYNLGTILHAAVTGTVSGKGPSGGLVAANAGTISQSTSGAFVYGGDAGGLAAENVASVGTIDTSFATGSVEGNKPGGLVGNNQGQIEESFATGSVSGNGFGGGLVGSNNGSISQSYATGLVSSSIRGGLIGEDTATNAIQTAYWDMDTSGITDPGQGAGTPRNDPGITGLTDAQLKSALPAGFDPNVWGQNAGINNGWPYLLANPPLQ